MADYNSDEDNSPNITITLKSTSENHTIETKENSTVRKVKERLSEKINQPVEKICLIFSGKILKDHDTLQTYTATATTTTSGGTPPGTQRPATTTASPQIPGLGINLDSARRMMNNPMVQNMLSNPEFLRSMISSNEQIQNIARQNPEIGHLLNDPEIIRQTIEMIRNPNMFNEMMRNHDQAIRNLQGIPGGEAALQRLYQDVQEPLLNSATGGTNPFASSSNTNDSNIESRSQRAGVENAEALPNPWGGVPSPNPNPTSTNPSPAPATGDASGMLGNLNEMMNAPGMQDMMRSMMSNPEFMRTMMSPQMLQQARQMFGDSLPPDEDMSRLSEQFGSLISNPEVTTGLTNPRVMEAMNNIRTNIEIIRNEAPGLFRTMFAGLDGLMSQTSTTSSSNTTARQSTPTDTAAGTGSAPNLFGQNPQQLIQLLGQMGGAAGLGGLSGLAGGAPDNRPPEERFRSQLEQLVSMGFTNQEANLRAIQEAHGDVNGAIDRLLNQGNR
ncbi:hypothetical protein FO519_008057 [Halicephalobus sp. NKZ332]|nr:hypothetical protein FO519_008057 [Halicephalobus sp. NKZ332]